MFKGIEFFKGNSRGEGFGLLRRNTPRNEICSVGRSMIEMLGVLAIVGVLSVGGIAGYSKAMEMWKIDKIINEYNNLIFGLLEHKQNLQKSLEETISLVDISLADTSFSLNLVPKTWKKISFQYMQDECGNFVGPYYRPRSSIRNDDSPEQSGIIIDFIFGGLKKDESGKEIAADFNDKVCFDILDKIVFPLSYTITGTILAGGSGYYYGKEFCNSGRKCISTMTLQQMKSMCNSCNKTGRCALTIIF